MNPNKINDYESNELLIQLPQRIVDLYGLQKDDIVNVHADESSITIRFSDKDKQQRLVSNLSFLIPSFFTSIVFILSFSIQNIFQIPLVGDTSIASFVLSIGILSGILNLIYLFLHSKKNKLQNNIQLISYRTFPTILMAFSIILFLILLFAFRFIGLLFEGVQFDLWTSTFISFVFISLINYSMTYIANTITTRIIMNTLAITMLGGAIISMVTNSDLQWWKYNLSFLGTPEAINSWNFNITLIFSALLMLALIDFLFVNLENRFDKTKNLIAFRILLILIALNLAGVGLFPYNDNILFQKIHNRTAFNLVYLIILLIASIRWLLPKLSESFAQLSYSIGGVLLITVILFEGIGYLSLTAFELIAFILAFSWLFLLFQEMERIIYEADTIFEVKIK